MIVNPTSQKWIDGYIQSSSAAFIVYAKDDISSAEKVAGLVQSKLSNEASQPLILMQFDDKKSIGIDDVRSLQRQLTLKANASSSVSRIIAIKDAQKLTIEAQNALLKLIEELPERTIIALLCSSMTTILPTITSRCFMIELLPITLEQAYELGDANGLTQEETKKKLLVSDGRVSLFTQMMTGQDEAFEVFVSDAKEFLRASVFDRQKLLTKILDKKYELETFVDALKITTKSAMRHAPNIEARTLWKEKLKAVLQAEELLSKNTSPKLTLLSLSVEL